ncbi:Nn.00g016940.m01.CDS01 [Neocucurbitaria sp. VM-36]
MGKRTRQQLTPESDMDGDSTMHSSPSLNGNDDDEMFPDEALSHNPNPDPSTPHHPALNLASRELSPPNSQSQPRDPASLTQGVNANGKRPLSLAQTAAGMQGGSHQDAETGYQWSKQEEQPGYDWKNTRAREEEARALETIIDKGSQIKLRYGDPLDPSVAAKVKR